MLRMMGVKAAVESISSPHSGMSNASTSPGGAALAPAAPVFGEWASPLRSGAGCMDMPLPLLLLLARVPCLQTMKAAQPSYEGKKRERETEQQRTS